MEQKILKKLLYFKNLRWACRFIVMVATGVSVWANVLGSRPTPQAIAINVLPPVLVLLGFEMGSRVPQRVDARWYHKLPRLAGMVAITSFGAWLSYWHQREAFMYFSGDQQTARLLPLSIDGLMVIASVCVLDLNTRVLELELAGESNTIKMTVAKPKDDKTGPKSKRDLIIEILTKYPTWPPAKVAAKTKASEGYVYSLKKELDKMSGADDSVLATA